MRDKPNVVVITTHDSGRHFGCYGVDTVHTPNIDAIAADGVTLTNYFAASPICCAARAAVMTGQYPLLHGPPRMPYYDDVMAQYKQWKETRRRS